MRWNQEKTTWSTSVFKINLKQLKRSRTSRNFDFWDTHQEDEELVVIDMILSFEGVYSQIRFSFGQKETKIQILPWNQTHNSEKKA